MATILVIHTSATVRELAGVKLRDDGHEVAIAASPREAQAMCRERRYDVVVTDVGIDIENGTGGALAVPPSVPDARVVTLGSAADLPDVLEAVRNEASRSDISEIYAVPQGIVAVDPVTRAVFARAKRVASADSAVFITGETGTGKEVLAQMIHRCSARRVHPFVTINCGGLPETLVESELFGYRKGAFTGAWSDKMGLAEVADRGVLFLDEVGEMPLPTQARLLRFLDTGQILRLGETRPRSLCVRIIAATNRDPAAEVERGRLRLDLLYRLRGVPLHMPPLRARRHDIRDLAATFLRSSVPRSGERAPQLSDDAWAWLFDYRWPGNVRELKHVVQAAAALSSDDTITRLDLIEAAGMVQDVEVETRDVARDSDERQRLIVALEAARGNRSEAAKVLGISRTTLWRSLRRFQIQFRPRAAR